ncbi:FG-GAP-like repeat-containing protein [Actinopolyspora mortivallis]|uniref:FG-GAP-like repeat-containing protein n=1 Tax=Actinopolyspora mortivallis TaxID=33906 RepID=UPI00146A09B0|nr:FG-GAP-like repeat-containing protein [Actinopolyspora mortivallis]
MVDLVPRTDRNLVLAKLGSTVEGVTPVRLSENAASQGDTLRSAGYGRTATEWTPDTPHTGTFSVEAVEGTSLSVLGTSEQDSICKGDAGGPVLRQVNERVELVGINSASWQHGCFGEDTTKRGATVARTDDLVGWVNSGIVGLSALGRKHSINVSWLPTGGQQYRLYGSTSPEVPLQESNLLVTTNGTDFTHKALSAGQTWYYRVVPFYSNGAGTPSNIVQAKVSSETGTDFNGDGYEDVAAFSVDDSDDINISNSNGNGFEKEFKKSSKFVSEAQDRLNGDFNGDGKSDLLITRVADYSAILVYVALSGDSGFDDFKLWGTVGTINNIRVGDFNGDGKDDIVRFHGMLTGKAYVSLSDGSGFMDEEVWHDDFAMSFKPEIPAVGDFNGDGKDDIITFLRGDDGRVFVSVSDGQSFIEDNALWHKSFCLSTCRPLPSIPAPTS